MNKRDQQQDDSQQRDCEYRPLGETQGEHDTALRGFGGDGFSYDKNDPRHALAEERAHQSETPCQDGEYYGDEQQGGSRDPKSMSSVGWGGEGGGFSGNPSEFGDDPPGQRPGDAPLERHEGSGGGVLSGVPGQRGRGPKGYLRNDADIADTVHQRLTDDDDVDASGITVLVHDGEVTLTGQIESRQMKRQAEDLVASCSGVRDVLNHLKVGEAHS